jgi:hypothetical protein
MANANSTLSIALNINGLNTLSIVGLNKKTKLQLYAVYKKFALNRKTQIG